MTFHIRPRAVGALAATSLLTLALVAPAVANPPVEVPDAHLVVDDEQLAPEGTILTRRDDAPVVPGVHYTSFDRYAPAGWLRGDLLTLDLTSDSFELDYVNSGSVAETDTLTNQLNGAGAIAGVNGDGFDINDTGAPNGLGIKRDGEVIQAYAEGTQFRRGPSAIIGSDGLGEVAQLFLDATATDGEFTHSIEYLNSPRVSADAIALYTDDWGDVALTRTLEGATNTWQVLIRDGVVVSSGATVDQAQLADNEQVLVGRDGAVAELAEFTTGEAITVEYAMKGSDDIAMAINGFFPVALNGEVVTSNDTDLHPRTVLALSEDGSEMALLTVDGRQSTSRGMTEVETAEFFLGMGFDDVLNLDGGGSSQLNARLAGQDAPAIRSSPSDGGERHTANSIGILPTAEGSGEARDFSLVATNSMMKGADADASRDLYVMTGLSRVVTAQAYDETFAPVESAPAWKVLGENARVSATSEPDTVVLTGRAAGTTEVVMGQGDASSREEIVVVGAPVRVSTSTPQVSLASIEARSSFQVFGHDAQGFSTWVEPRDVDLDYDESLVRIEAVDDHFVVTPLVDSGAAVITVEVVGLTTQLAASIGLASTVIDDMESMTGWSAVKYPSYVGASASLAVGEGRDGGNAIALDYSLTGGTATRAAYLAKSPRPVLEGTPQKLGVWVHGDGKGAWLRANIYEATGGAAKTIDVAAAIDWTGWRYVEANLPAGLNMPISFFRFYLVETVPARQYSGRVLFDDVTVRSAPTIPPLSVSKEINPALVADGGIPESYWRYAVLSDAQFTADAPNSDIVAQARRTLREALAADPEFIIIAGDFVDRGFARDIELAKRVIDEEIGDAVPVHYVPGNHEYAGPGSLAAWSKVFGEPARTFDHLGTRFIIRSTPGYTLRSGGFEQILDLKAQLDDAATDPGVNNVVVVQHHPMTDPSATGGSAISDPLEAEMLADWLADFKLASGKGVALQGAGVGTFHASSTDGVLQLINGNSGKSPTAAPGEGGFTGWSLIGINPEAVAQPLTGRRWEEPVEWIKVAMTPHVDQLVIDAPATAAVGEAVTVTATVVQDGREVPVAYPVAADWAVSDGARFDAATGRFVATVAGTHTVSVTVNGETSQVSITVA
ncbi:phosphodiester glycosidase family protein [Tessaracoccus sp. OS52]|uniref:phosphodiester glycosidase family protein n=1 Tax=Tessaracoccus sp. OS52 TaxID=2886691 RepID=UPI001D129C39|nr:phosphodiester glycosidase family protein [Tessaracoccus sp. OS52]MCC2593598.1 phosphodiester glycosidase family protein [Tessaracoccus sp. OS52]